MREHDSLSARPPGETSIIRRRLSLLENQNGRTVSIIGSGVVDRHNVYWIVPRGCGDCLRELVNKWDRLHYNEAKGKNILSADVSRRCIDFDRELSKLKDARYSIFDFYPVAERFSQARYVRKLHLRLLTGAGKGRDAASGAELESRSESNFQQHLPAARDSGCCD